MLTAGLRWAPLTAPMNRMIAITISAGATTSAGPGMTWPPNLALTIPPPAATRTRKNVPSNSEKTRRHSYRLSQKSKRRAKAFGSPMECSAIAISRPGRGEAPAPAGRPWGLLTGTPPLRNRPARARSARSPTDRAGITEDLTSGLRASEERAARGARHSLEVRDVEPDVLSQVKGVLADPGLDGVGVPGLDGLEDVR